MPTKRKAKPTKPKKPYAGFPLTANGNGQWSKKILGEVHYFGVWADPQGAVERFKAERDYLYAGQAAPDGTSTLADVLDAFRQSKRHAVEMGELTPRSLDEYETVCDQIAKVLNEKRSVESISTADFIRLKTAISKGMKGKVRSPVSLKRVIGMARMVFNFANEELEPPLTRPVRYRKALRLPPAKAIRAARNKVGERLFTAAEINSLLAIAKPQLKAMIYLGVNCGYGNGDCSHLPIAAVDLAGGWVTFARPKTGIHRRCPLWPETAAALYAVIKDRKSGLVFMTKYGNPWEGKGRADPISYEFRKLVRELKMHRKGVTTFYSLRRTFETIGAAAGDQVAVDYIMGHAPSSNDMGAVYRQRTFDNQLQKVTDYVHAWLSGVVSLR